MHIPFTHISHKTVKFSLFSPPHPHTHFTERDTHTHHCPERHSQSTAVSLVDILVGNVQVRLVTDFVDGHELDPVGPVVRSERSCVEVRMVNKHAHVLKKK